MFDQRTLDFLYHNFKNNSREWFKEHKQDYIKYVQEPLYDMVSIMAPTMHSIDPQFNTDPKQITSRIYRDMRFNPEGFFYRDHMWITFMRPGKVYNGLPGYFFERNPYNVTFGCGFYHASAASMKKWRELILANTPTFQKAFEAFNNQNIFILDGEEYKTNNFEGYDESIQKWLNKKTVCLIAKSNDINFFLDEKLPEKIAKAFLDIKPIYDFMMLLN